jgi:dTDP-4-dehydrorhamnose reductase
MKKEVVAGWLYLHLFLTMMKMLVTGANGLLGQHLVKLLLANDFIVVATGKGPCRLPFEQGDRFRYFPADISSPMGLQEIFRKEQPAIVVHAAAMTQLDECEVKQDESFNVNVQGTIHTLLDAESFSSFFIYVSTDFVFDGVTGNYKEDDDQNPLSWYGFTKVQAESMVQTANMPWAIVRTCLVYGNPRTGARSNIITWVKKSLEEGKKIKVVSDQLRTPTYVEDLARGILLIAQGRKAGVFHIAGKDLLTPYQMALETANYLGLDSSLIEKVDASVFTQPAKRPPKTGLDITKARNQLGYEPLSFSEGLRKTVMVDG